MSFENNNSFQKTDRVDAIQSDNSSLHHQCMLSQIDAHALRKDQAATAEGKANSPTAEGTTTRARPSDGQIDAHALPKDQVSQGHAHALRKDQATIADGKANSSTAEGTTTRARLSNSVDQLLLPKLQLHG
jgi:hypothetical protein